MTPTMSESADGSVPLSTIVREWSRIGVIGFGGPPAHIALLRKLCVEERGWLSAHEFEDGISATNLLPRTGVDSAGDPVRVATSRAPGAVIGGVCFIVPGLVIILALSAIFLASNPAALGPRRGRRSRSGGARGRSQRRHVASFRRVGGGWRTSAPRVRWVGYFLVGGSLSGHDRPVPRPRPLRVRGDRDRRPGRLQQISGRTAFRLFPPARRQSVRADCAAWLGGAQSRSALLRRRVRHRPAYAARRRRDLPLDDRRAVPQCRGARPDHAGAGRPDRRGRGLSPPEGSAAACWPRSSPSRRRSASSSPARLTSTGSG